MTTVVVRSRVDADGVLRVAVPIGTADAEQEVQLTIEPVPAKKDKQAEYIVWLENSAGQWQGDFERLPQGDYEKRDSL